MAKGLSPREFRSIENIKQLLKDTIVGSVQIAPNAQITKRNGKLLDKPTKAMGDAFLHIKFHYKFMIGIVGRRTNGTPYMAYEFVSPSTHVKLFEDDLSELIFQDLKKRFYEEDEQTRLTSFWLASPNPDMDDNEFVTTFLQLMDKYKVFDNMATQYEIDNKIDRGRSLHNTSYWYGLLELEEIQYEEKEAVWLTL